MNKKLISKLLATMLVITLTFANVLLLGNYANKAYATENNLDSQSVLTNNSNVEFDAYYVDKSGKTTHAITQDMDSTDLQLYLYAKVTKGYLKDIKVNMFGEEEGKSTNFTIPSTTKDLSTIESIDTDNNIIKLKQLDKDTQVIIKVPVYANKDNTYDLANFNKQNNVKVTATYVNDAGKEIAITKTVKTSIEWTAGIKAVAEQELVKNVSLNNGTMLQTAVRTGLENNNLPIQKTNIDVTAPTIDGIKPIKAIVIANQTKATNGKEGNAFNENNWSYNETTGVLNINVENTATDNKVAWDKTQKDEYIITYIYPETALAKITEGLDVKQNVAVKITAYGTTTQEALTSQEMSIDMLTKQGEIISSTISNTMTQLSKGYFYSNINKDIEYTIKNTVQISDVDLVNRILIGNKTDELLTGERTTALGDLSVYHSTMVNKEIFDKLLGEDGYINIYGAQGNLISTINKESTVENGNYIYNYEEQINAIIIETSKPITEGNLIIESNKTINCSTSYTNEQLNSFDNLKTSTIVRGMLNNQEISNVSKYTLTQLIEPETKMEAEINKTELSTVLKNEGVQIKVILKTNDETCMLYENPVVELELPSYVEGIEINGINLSYDNELSYDSSKLSITTATNGNKIIRIPLTGKDTDYNFDNLSKGANLIIDANLILGTLTPTTNSNINVNVYNNNGSGQTANAQIAVTAVAPVGMVTTTQISEYNARSASIMALNGEEQTVKLDVNSDAKIATVEMNIINNYNNICKNISVLGKIPYSLATLNTPITVNNIDSNKVTIYYTTNENATKDLSLTSNGWSTNVENLSQVKAYLIVINNYEMTTGQSITVNYNLSIPEKLNYNLEGELTYTVYYDNVTTEQTINDTTTSARTVFTTGQGPELQVSVKSDRENGAEIQEGSVVKYIVTVKNIGKTAVENVTLKGNVPDGTVYFIYEGSGEGEEGINKIYDNTKTEYAEKIEVIQPDETKTIEYYVEVQNLKYVEELEEGDEILEDEIEDEEYNDSNIDYSKLVLEEKELNVTGQAIVDGYDKIFTSDVIKNKVVQGYLNVSMEIPAIDTNVARAEGEVIQYTINISNINTDEKKDTVVTCALPEDLAFVGANNNPKYDEATNTITWELGTIGAKGTKTLTLLTKIIDLEDNVYEKDIINKAKIKTSEKEIETNEVTIKVTKPALSVKLSTDTTDAINPGETIKYSVTVENTGKGTATDVKIEDNLPVGLLYESAQYTYNGKTYEANIGGDRAAIITIPTLKAGEKVEVELTVTADTLARNEERREVTNIVTVYSKEVTEITSNEVKNVILATGKTDDPTTGGDVVEGTYKISGTAWLDSDKNGKRDDGEQTLSNIQVMLIDASNGQVVKDISTGNDKIQTTNSEGVYTFTNIEPGKYIVVFLYDTNTYRLTEYKKEGVTSSRNSDAISTNVNIDGTTKEAAATDTIEITSSSARNMDLGLVLKSRFNLSLDKTITKITVSNSKETKIYEYKDTKLAKVDLNAKTISDTNIVIEYKIKVSNIGDVEGYAKRIVDYIPQDMKFSSELNQDWYASDNGNIYNSSLANAVIKPGETKELTLVLTKKMTEENTGIVNNKAEIYEAYNNLGLADEDSTPANKVESENDMSSADAAISIKTGETTMYVGITIGLIAFFAIGLYFIKKKVLNKI